MEFEFIRRLRHKLHDRHLEKAVSRMSQSHRSLAFGDVKHVGFLFDAEKTAHFKAVKAFVNRFKELNRQVKVLGYFKGKNAHDNLEYRTFSQKDLDWYLRPKGFEVENFQRHRLDVLINCCLSPELPLEYLAATSSAQFRIGPFTNNPHCYDLMLDVPDPEDIQHYLKRVEHFLNHLNQSKHEPKST